MAFCWFLLGVETIFMLLGDRFHGDRPALTACFWRDRPSLIHELRMGTMDTRNHNRNIHRLQHRQVIRTIAEPHRCNWGCRPKG